MRIIQLGIFALIVTGIYLTFGNKSATVPLGKGSINELQTKAADFKGILLGSRKNQVMSLASTDAACQDLWDRIRGLDLQRLNDDIFRGCLLLPARGECAEPPRALLSTHDAYLKECAIFMDAGYDKHSDPELDEKGQSCFLSLVAYRSAVGSWLTKDQPLSEIADVQALGDKLLNEMFTSMRGENASVSNVRAIAERVNELNPNIYSTSKITAVGDIMDALSDSSSDHWSKAKRSLEKLERFNSDDPEIAQLGLWVRTEGMKPEKLLEEASRMVKDNPNSGLGYFYQAFAEAGTGNREKVGALFMSAVQAEPNNPTFVRALENYRAKRPVPPPFEFDFSFQVAELTERG